MKKKYFILVAFLLLLFRSQLLAQNTNCVKLIPTAATICQGDSVVLTANVPANWTPATGLSSTYGTVVKASPSVTTTYDCQAPGCLLKPQITVVVNPKPIVSIVGNGSICDSSNSVFDAGYGFSSYLWSTFSSNQTINVSLAGTYFVTVTNSFNCSASASKNLIVYPIPTVSIYGPNEICFGQTETFDAGGGYLSYNWSTGATTQTIQASSAGIYTVTVSDIGGCTASSSKTVSLNYFPVAAISGDTSICSGASTVLSASGGTSYFWSTGDTTSSITINSPGSYLVIATNACGNSNALINVSSNPTPIAIISANGSTKLCNGDSLILTASGGNNYLWSNGATTASITVSTAANYVVTVYNSIGCSASSSQLISFESPPYANITATDTTTFCQGDSVMLIASGNGNYLWSTGATTDTITADATLIYTLSVINSCGIATSSQSVTVLPYPNITITASGPTKYCQGDSVILTASGGVNYSWSNGATNASITVNASGTYSVSTSNACGSSSTSINILVESPPYANITATDTTTFCQGDSVMLIASGNGNYLWSTGATTDTITADATLIYTLSVINSCGIATSSQSVTVLPYPNITITASGPTKYCQGDSVILTASGGVNYSWSNGATNASITVNASGTYSVSTSNACGSSSTSINILVESPPYANITATDTTIFCQGDSVLLIASGNGNYIWSTGATTDTIKADATLIYTLSVINSCGIATASQSVTVNPLPIGSITANGSSTFCQGDSVNLKASGGISYLWSTGETDSLISVSTEGTYYVTVTNEFNCHVTISQDIQVDTVPITTILTYQSATFCQGDSAILSATGNGSFLWSTGETTSSIKVNSAGIYTVALSNACGSSSSSQVITVNPNPIASISLNGPSNFCQGDSVSLTATGGSYYQWTNPETSDSSITVSTSGIYEVTVYNDFGCSAMASQTIQVDTFSIAVITISGPSTICNGDSTILIATGGNQFLWSTGETTNTIIVSASGTYSVTATNTCKSNSVSVTINSGQGVAVNPIADYTICNGQAANGLLFSSTDSTATFIWNSLNNLNIGFGFSGSDSLPYYVAGNLNNSSITDTLIVYASINGCAGSNDTLLITVNPTPHINPLTDLHYCNGDSLNTNIDFSSSDSSATFNWISNFDVGFGLSGSGNVSQFVATNNTYYPITATVIASVEANSCLGPDAVFNITVNPTPKVNPLNDTIICSGSYFGGINLSCNSPDSTLFWSCSNTAIGIGAASGTNTIPVFMALNTTGNSISSVFTVYAMANDCISDTVHFIITVNPTPQVNSVMNQSFCSNSFITSGINFSSSALDSSFEWTCTTNLGFGYSGTGSILPFYSINTDSNSVSSLVTVHAISNGCKGPDSTFMITINPKPILSPITDKTFCHGDSMPAIIFASNPFGAMFQWSCYPNIGLDVLAGTGDIPADTAKNNSKPAVPIFATINIYPTLNGCKGDSQTFNITVLPIPAKPILTSFLFDTTSVCSGASNLSFFVKNLLPSLSYLWSSSPTNLFNDSTHFYAVASFNNLGNTVANIYVTAIDSTSLGVCKSTDMISLNIVSNGNDSITKRPILKKEPGHVLIYPDNSIDSYQWGYDEILNPGAPFSQQVYGPSIKLDNKVYQFFLPDNKFILDSIDQLDTINYCYWVYIKNGECFSKIYYNGRYSKRIMEDIPIDNTVNLNVYPNPNNGQFNISVSGKIYGEMDIRIYNQMGQQVFETVTDKKIPLITLPVELKNLSNGIYLLKLQSSDLKAISTRLIIQH